VVSTSFTNSVPLPRSHCERKGPERADLKVRGDPEGSRWRTGPAEDEMEVRDEVEGGNQVGLEGTEGGRGERV
jgi:hypothetical protein